MRLWLVVGVAALPSWLLLYSVRTPVTGQSRAHTGCTLHVCLLFAARAGWPGMGRWGSSTTFMMAMQFCVYMYSRPAVVRAGEGIVPGWLVSQDCRSRVGGIHVPATIEPGDEARRSGTRGQRQL